MSNGDLFSWIVGEHPSHSPELGAVGICDDRDRARRGPVAALRVSPARAFGSPHEVRLSPISEEAAL